MSSTFTKNTVDKMVIHLRSDATILVEKHTGDMVNSKFINPDDLFSCIKDSYSHIGIESGILPENTVFYREEQDKTRRIVIKVLSGHFDITYYDTFYLAFPLPTMLFGFTISSGGHISTKKLIVVGEGVLGNESRLYHYPFSNVNQYNSDICTGRNRLFDIQELRQLGSLPYYILSIPNNDDYFNAKYNRQGMGYRELLEYLKDKEPWVYYNEVLVESGRNLSFFVNQLKTT